MDLIEIIADLRDEVQGMRFADPVSHVYNPLEYAWENHRAYLERYGRPPREIVLVGMNPGPWGMAQNGVPFGEVSAVRNWIGITGAVGRPVDKHPKRPVLGLECTRSEVTGRRVWSWAAERFGSAEAFFARFFVYNYCPLMFLEAGGRNRTPDRLPATEREPLFAACDRALLRVVEHLGPRLVVGIGAFARKRAEHALGRLAGQQPQIGQVLHPSPASPAANRGWADQAELELSQLGVELPSSQA